MLRPAAGLAGWLAVAVMLWAAATLVVLTAWLAGLLAALAGGWAAERLSARHVRAAWMLLAFGGLALAVSAPRTADDLTAGLRALGDRAIAQGPRSLHRGERVALWSFGLAMAGGAFVAGAPHAALAQLRLYTAKDGPVVVESDFPMGARAVRRFVTDAGFGRSHTSLWWRGYYVDDHDVALTLNGGTLTVERGEATCTATAGVDGRYQPRYRRSTVVDAWGVRLRIDQAAFWALQELGWLHPYELRYRWSC